MAENKTDYTLPRTDLIELLPEPLQSDVNLSIFDNVFNRYLTKQEIEKVAGYIGRGNPNALRARQIHETDVHRQGYQLQPIPYNKIGSIEHMTSWKDMQNELERLGVDISDFDDWGTTQKFNWVPPIDINKIINYRDYYWVDKDEPNSTPQYITIRNTCATATARFNFWETLIIQYGASMPIDEILPAVDTPTTFTITDFPTANTLQIEGDITEEILLGDFIDIVNTTSNDGTYFVNAAPTYSGVTNETTIQVSTTLVTGSPVPDATLALRRFNKIVLNANTTLESGDYTGLYEEGFVFFVRNSTNTDLNNAFVEVVDSTYDSFLNQTTVTINYRVTDDTADGEASLEEQLSIFETDMKCQCGDFGGWDISQWDDNPREPLWGDDEGAAGSPNPDGISDHTNLITRISQTTTPVSGVGVEGELWYDTVDNILYQADAAINWVIIWRNFSLILEQTTGIDLWDLSLACDTRPRIDATSQWISQNHWLHKNDVINFATVTRASLPIIEYDWDLELNEWTYINYNWSYRAENVFEFEPSVVAPPRIELEPLVWWEHGTGSPIDETITFDDRYGDLTDYFVPGQQVSFVDNLLKTTYTVVSSSYKTTDATASDGFPYRTFVTFDKVPPTFTVGGTNKLDNLSTPSPNAISIIPLNTTQGDPWEDYSIHWRFDSADDSLPVPHQSLNPYMDIDATETPLPYPPPPPGSPAIVPPVLFIALMTPVDFVSSNTVYVSADFEVDWGDGSFISYPAGNAISVATGDITVQSINEPIQAKFITDSYTDINITQSSSLTDSSFMCDLLTNLLSFDIADASNITTFENAWNGCSALVSLPYMDTSAGTIFINTFLDCIALVCLTALNTELFSDTTDLFTNTPSLANPTIPLQTALIGGYNYVNPDDCIGWHAIGDVFSVTSWTGQNSAATLSSTEIAFWEQTNDPLTKFSYSHPNWSQVGNALTYSASRAAITGLNSTDIALVDSDADEIKAFRFDGTDWQPLGFALAFTAQTAGELVTLSPTEVAFVGVSNNGDYLTKFSFDGTNWSQVGAALDIGPANWNTTVDIAALDSSTVVITVWEGNQNLRTFNFDGANWSQVGNTWTGGAVSGVAIAGLSATFNAPNTNNIAYIASLDDTLRTYHWDGTDWSEIYRPLTGLQHDSGSMTGLNSTDIAIIDNALDKIILYRLI